MLSDEEETSQVIPLEGIRILELGTFHAGPGAAAILGDLGAEVVKIEDAAGDPMRTWKEVGGITFSMANGEGLPFQFSNRNKKGICLDMDHPKGREIFQRLVRESRCLPDEPAKEHQNKTGYRLQHPEEHKPPDHSCEHFRIWSGGPVE